MTFSEFISVVSPTADQWKTGISFGLAIWVLHFWLRRTAFTPITVFIILFWGAILHTWDDERKLDRWVAGGQVKHSGKTYHLVEVRHD